jgi:hypothetical protein
MSKDQFILVLAEYIRMAERFDSETNIAAQVSYRIMQNSDAIGVEDKEKLKERIVELQEGLTRVMKYITISETSST